MSGRCEECGASTIWEQTLGSAICEECGTLADATQSVLTSHLECTDTSGREHLWNSVPGSSTLKGRNGWALAGQDKEGRNRRNLIAMHDFIRVIATRLGSPGVTTRAQGVFDQAMARGNYRWGRKAKLTAGAALAIALRESRKGDSLRDLAYSLDESPVALSRSFSAVVRLLGLELSPADPAAHIPALQTHFLNTLAAPAVLPAALSKALIPLTPSVPTVCHTASTLSALVSRTPLFTHLPTAPTACAFFLLALEAEAGTSLPHLAALAQALGARLGAGQGVVMQRYKAAYDLVEEWIREVPWLRAHKKHRTTGRALLGKRAVVARGLKDVLQFREELWRAHAPKPVVLIEPDTDEEGEGTVETQPPPPPTNKRKTRHERTVASASQFLLGASGGADAPPELVAHLLTAEASALLNAFAAAPTRLQLLAGARGGAGAEEIADEELFAEGELDGMLRTPEEAEAVRIAMGWDGDEDAAEREPEMKRGRKRRRSEEDRRSTTRIDMDALARVLDPSRTLDDEDDCAGADTGCGEGWDNAREESDEDVETCESAVSGVGAVDAGEGEVIEEWRPMSPGGGFDETWYET